MLLVLCVRASAVETDVRWGMSEKWSRGLVNAVSGWYEFPMQIHKGYDEGVGFIDAPAGNRSMGALFGTARGISHAIGRTGWGIIEFTGFWTSNHTTNTELRLLLDGNYAWEDGEKKSFRCPDVKAGMNRTGNRFKRGVQNVLFGWVEIPGQLHKSVKQGNVLSRGVPKALWYSTSRTYQGLADVVFVTIPGPEDNLNVPYDEIEGWDALHERFDNNR